MCICCHVPLPAGTSYISELHPQQPKPAPLGTAHLEPRGTDVLNFTSHFLLCLKRGLMKQFPIPLVAQWVLPRTCHSYTYNNNINVGDFPCSIFPQNRSLPEAKAGFSGSKIMCLPLIPYPFIGSVWPCWCWWPAPWVMERVTPREQDNENKREFEILHVAGCAK